MVTNHVFLGWGVVCIHTCIHVHCALTMLLLSLKTTVSECFVKWSCASNLECLEEIEENLGDDSENLYGYIKADSVLFVLAWARSRGYDRPLHHLKIMMLFYS